MKNNNIQLLSINKNSALSLVNAQDDIRGYSVKDKTGVTLGKVSDLFVEPGADFISFMELKKDKKEAYPPSGVRSVIQLPNGKGLSSINYLHLPIYKIEEIKNNQVIVDLERTENIPLYHLKIKDAYAKDIVNMEIDTVNESIFDNGYIQDGLRTGRAQSPNHYMSSKL